MESALRHVIEGGKLFTADASESPPSVGSPGQLARPFLQMIRKNN
jgi:hypothetical protein